MLCCAVLCVSWAVQGCCCLVVGIMCVCACGHAHPPDRHSDEASPPVLLLISVGSNRAVVGPWPWSLVPCLLDGLHACMTDCLLACVNACLLACWCQRLQLWSLMDGSPCCSLRGLASWSWQDQQHIVKPSCAGKPVAYGPADLALWSRWHSFRRCWGRGAGTVSGGSRQGSRAPIIGAWLQWC